MDLSFVVFGKPQPAGSKRAFAIRKGGVPTGQIAVTDANAKSKPWQQQVKLAAREAVASSPAALEWTSTGPVLEGPMSFSMTFYVQRPKSHYRTGRFSDQLKDSAPALPTSPPDVTKLVRGVEDALTGVIYKDDSQVTDQSACKRFGEPERVEVVVRFCPPASREEEAA